jgi:hypothetical protein
MSYTSRELIDKAYSDYLGDSKHQLWNDETLLGYLNDGYVEMAQKCKFTQKITQYDFLVGNTTGYTLPQDLLEINFFMVIGEQNPIPIERVNPHNVYDKDKIIMLGMNNFQFYTSEDKVAVLSYWNEPDKVGILDTVPISKVYQLGLIHYMCYRAYAKDQSTTNIEKAQYHFTEYQRIANQLSDTAFKAIQTQPLATKYQGF